VCAGLRVADGVLVVVDCMEGVCLHTETALRYALSERLKPVLVISKLDKAILDHQLVCTRSPNPPGNIVALYSLTWCCAQTPKALYARLRAIIESFNELAAIMRVEDLFDPYVRPQEGTVVFTSGLHGWYVPVVFVGFWRP
jgi:elongation factor 2